MSRDLKNNNHIYHKTRMPLPYLTKLTMIPEYYLLPSLDEAPPLPKNCPGLPGSGAPPGSLPAPPGSAQVPSILDSRVFHGKPSIRPYPTEPATGTHQRPQGSRANPHPTLEDVPPRFRPRCFLLGVRSCVLPQGLQCLSAPHPLGEHLQ